MKLCNICTENGMHLAVVTERGLVDATAAGCALTMNQLVKGVAVDELCAIAENAALPVVENPVFANILDPVGKLICVGLNYKDHAAGVNMKLPEYPILFSKFDNSLAPADAPVELAPWETSYDYEAELVLIIGKSAWGVSEEEAMDCVYGYTCGNDFSCRDAQMRSGQWLIGKAMPGFGPCGPYVVTADEFDPDKPHKISCYVNGELRQDGCTTDMIFNCAKVISYASKYIKLEPGDIIYTGTPSGVALEGGNKPWLKAGDKVDVVIEGIGTLTNTLV